MTLVEALDVFVGAVENSKSRREVAKMLVAVLMVLVVVNRSTGV